MRCICGHPSYLHWLKGSGNETVGVGPCHLLYSSGGSHEPYSCSCQSFRERTRWRLVALCVSLWVLLLAVLLFFSSCAPVLVVVPPSPPTAVPVPVPAVKANPYTEYDELLADHIRLLEARRAAEKASRP